LNLGEYVTALVASVRQCDSGAYARMCQIVGHRVARIQLDAESIYIRMETNDLIVETSADNGRPVDGLGITDFSTVLALLSGDLEASEAIMNGSLAIYGDLDQVNRMFLAIEILLDAVPRCPSMLKLSQLFIEQFQPHHAAAAAALVFPRASWYPFAANPGEFEFLSQYGLLPR
jgi:hypothetical protein